LFIIPCYGKKVKRRYNKSLKKNKIFLLSPHSETEFCFISANKYKKAGHVPSDKRLTKNVDLLIGDNNEFPDDQKVLNKMVSKILYSTP
jgi:hypothetical protein